MKANILKIRKPVSSLKERFLECFGVRAGNVATLQDVVRGLIDCGITRETLVAWASDAGFPETTIRSVLSRVFVSLGLRERQQGAGRRPSPAALILADYARRRWGKKFVNVLRAAWRVGKAQLAAEGLQTKTDGDTSGLIMAPQLGAPRIGSGRDTDPWSSNFTQDFKPAIASGRQKTRFHSERSLNPSKKMQAKNYEKLP